MKGSSKQNETKFLLQTKRFETNEISFQNILKFFIVTHLCHRLPLNIHVAAQ